MRNLMGLISSMIRFDADNGGAGGGGAADGGAGAASGGEAGGDAGAGDDAGGDGGDAGGDDAAGLMSAEDLGLGGEKPGEGSEKPGGAAGGEGSEAAGGAGDAGGGAPESYEAFTLGEGFTLTDAKVTELQAFGKDKGLTQDMLQGVVDLWAGQEKSYDAAIAEERADNTKAWIGQVKADKELGGSEENQTETVNRASRAMQRFGNDVLIGLLKETGLNMHPEVMRLMVKVDRATGEGEFFTGDRQPGKSGTKTSTAKAMYPNMGEGAKE